MSSFPLISIITRTMGRDCLPRAVASVTAQTWRPIEFIIVNASGKSQDVIGSSIAGLPLDVKVTVVDRGAPLLRAVAANAGLDVAAGEWIAFLDEDDEWLPEHLAGLMGPRDTTAERVRYCDARLIGADGAEMGIIGGPIDALRMHASSPCAIHAAVVHRSLIDGGVRFDERLTHREDQDFWLQAIERTTFHHVDQTTAIYHVVAGDSGTHEGISGSRKEVSESERVLAEKWRAQRNTLASEMQAAVRGAQGALMARDYATCEQLLMQTLSRFPKEANAYNLLGMTHLETGRTDSALSLLKQAAVLAPGHYGVVFNLGLAFEHSGATADARACFQRALQLNPGFAAAAKKLA